VSIRRNQAPARVERARKSEKVSIASTAKLRYLRASAQKTRLVVDQIRGLRVDEARAILKNSIKRVAKDVLKVLQSAHANTEAKADQAAMFDADSLFVTRAWVDEGPMMKRTQPAPMGRAYPIRKRTCHVTIELGSIAALPAPRRGRAGRGEGKKATTEKKSAAK
jgi:large subunit ribosomal protein L22